MLEVVLSFGTISPLKFSSKEISVKVSKEDNISQDISTMIYFLNISKVIHCIKTPPISPVLLFAPYFNLLRNSDHLTSAGLRHIRLPFVYSLDSGAFPEKYSLGSSYRPFC